MQETTNKTWQDNNTFVVNENLSKVNLWLEIESRGAVIADTMKYLEYSSRDDDLASGVLAILRQAFIEYQALIEQIERPEECT